MNNKEVLQYFEKNNLDQLLLRLSCSLPLTEQFAKMCNRGKVLSDKFKEFFDFCCLSADGTNFLFHNSSKTFIDLVFKNKLISVKDLVDLPLKHSICVVPVIENCFEYLEKYEMLKKEDIEYLLQKIDKEKKEVSKFFDIDDLLSTESLIAYVLDNDLLSLSRMQNYDKTLEKRNKKQSLKNWYSSPELEKYSVVEVLSYYAYTDKLFEYAEQYKTLIKFKVCLTDEKFFEVLHAIRDDSEKFEKLKYLANNNLENAFSNFDELLACLSKKSKKHSLTF